MIGGGVDLVEFSASDDPFDWTEIPAADINNEGSNLPTEEESLVMLIDGTNKQVNARASFSLALNDPEAEYVTTLANNSEFFFRFTPKNGNRFRTDRAAIVRKLDNRGAAYGAAGAIVVTGEVTRGMAGTNYVSDPET